MRTLVVDDSKTMRSLIRGVLTQMGHTTVDEAASGPDALERVASCRPDLILVDWNMPGMDGLTFVRTIRARGNAASIILLTTETGKSRVIAAIKAGVDNYVVKPFTPDVLHQRIAETISRLRVA